MADNQEHIGLSPSVIVYTILLIIFTSIGNLGNFCVLGAVFCDKRLRTESNVFIVNLAIADLCVSFFLFFSIFFYF